MESTDLQIVVMNIQQVVTRNHAHNFLLLSYSCSTTDLDLFLEAACKTSEQVTDWIAECEGLGLGSIFTVKGQIALSWRWASCFVSSNTPPTMDNDAISSSSPKLLPNLMTTVLTIAGRLSGISPSTPLAEVARR